MAKTNPLFAISLLKYSIISEINEHYLKGHNVIINKKIEKEKIYVKIKKGVDSGEIIIIRDMGNVINQTLKGDIKLFIPPISKLTLGQQF